MSLVTQIANAVAKELNDATFSRQFQAVYAAKPGFELAELDTLRVIVVPKTLEIERTARSATKFTVTVDVGVMQRIGKMTPDEAVEKLGDLVDEIAQAIKDRELTDFPEATFLGITNNPIYVPEHLVSNRTFTSVLNVKYVFLN